MRRLTPTSIAAVCAALLLGLAPVAKASPEPNLPGAGQVRLALDAVGSDSGLALYGLQGTQSLTVPVPQGLAPSSVDALVELPVGVRAGTITVSQDDRTLSRIPLPTDFQAPVSIPLAGAEVVDNAVTVMLRSYLEPVEGYCLFDPAVPLRLSQASVTFSGAETPPTMVADFLPPVLQQLDLFIPSRPSKAESDSAIRVASAVAAHYGKQHPLITVNPLDAGQTTPPQPSRPLQRQVVIREGAERGLTLHGASGMPSLSIGGPPDELANQTRALSGDVGRLALSSKAVAGPLRPVPQLASDVTTIRQLGQPGVNATALAPQVSIALDQTRLGRPSRDIRVHLRGSYTPLPSSVGGQIVAGVAGETIDRWTADNSGVIDRWVGIPDRLLQRYINLGVAMNITGDTGRCGQFQPITLTIDGDSPVQSTLAKPPFPNGFQSLPQALMPKVLLGIDQTFDDTRRALALVVGLQRLSALPMDTEVTAREQAVSSSLPAILVDAGAWTDSRITLPVSAGTHSEINVSDADGTGQQATLTLDPALHFASLQTAFTGNRTVLVASSNAAPEQLDSLLQWLDSDVQHWSRLTGNALIAAPGHAPVMVGVASTATPSVVESRSPLRPWLSIATGVVVIVCVVIALTMLRARRSRAKQ